MKFEFDANELGPLIERAVLQTLKKVEQQNVKLDGRLAYTESEAAALLGVERHVLRDARLRGEITASKVGKRIVYSRIELEAYLTRNRL